MPHSPSDLVGIVNNVAVTTSLIVAQKFGKQHKDVLRAIQDLECSDEFHRRNFTPISYRDRYNREQPCVEMTRDGFSFLGMGFTGREAAKWKEDYISAFNAMETELLQQKQPARSALTALEYVQRIEKSLPNLGETALQQLYSRASEIDFGVPLIPAPVIVGKYYTATELAEEFGVSRNKIGRIANQHGLKTPEFGEFRLTKAEHSDKQVEQFYYNERGRQALALAVSTGESKHS